MERSFDKSKLIRDQEAGCTNINSSFVRRRALDVHMVSAWDSTRSSKEMLFGFSFDGYIIVPKWRLLFRCNRLG